MEADQEGFIDYYRAISNNNTSIIAKSTSTSLFPFYSSPRQYMVAPSIPEFINVPVYFMFPRDQRSISNTQRVVSDYFALQRIGER